jgi:alpha-tubulin suppressor-like RCC1 family protein
MDTSNFCPPKSTEPFAKLAIGTSHCAGITFMGELFCFGLNDKSQCAIRSDKNEFLLLPVHVNLENDVSLLSTTVVSLHFFVYHDFTQLNSNFVADYARGLRRTAYSGGDRRRRAGDNIPV